VRRMVAGTVWVWIAVAGVARADSGWREIQGPHVTLRTDLSSGAAKEAAVTVERFRAEIIAGAWPRATLPSADRIEVTVFANGLDFEHHFGRNTLGVFFHDLPPYAILYGNPDRWEHRASAASRETTSVLRHELVHHLAASIYRRQPRWFAEGLAQFLETVRVSDDGKSVVVGAVNLEALRKYHAFRSLRVADALSWSAKLDSMPEGTVHGLYGLSWVMVHWLYNAHPQQFDQLQGLLARGIDPDKAWKIILPGLNTPDIDEALHLYVKHGDYTEFLAPFTPPAPALTETALSEADVHAERARVALAAARHGSDPAPHREEARRELAQALAIDKANASALVLQWRASPPEQRAALARTLTTTHPEDGRGWILLAEGLRDPASVPEREAALRKAMALRPDDPTPLNNLAWIYVNQGKATEAVPLITRAVQLAPYDPNMLDTLAAVQAVLGRCSEAVTTEARAIDALPEGVPAAVRHDFEARMQKYRTVCTSPPAATAGGGSPPG
jgi:tetratricopeptide (TPR) repeat protein